MLTTDSGFTINTLGVKVGAEIIGADLRKHLSAAAFAEIEDTFYRYSVVVIRLMQELTTKELVEFSRLFGTLQINVRSKTKNQRCRYSDHAGRAGSHLYFQCKKRR